MLEFKKYEGVIHWICGVSRASCFALKRNPRNHRIVCGRHGLCRDWFFWHLNSSHLQHLKYHPRSLWWNSWLCILVPQSDSFQVPLPVFLFTYIPSASSCRLSPCFRLSLVHAPTFSTDAVIFLHSMSHPKLLTGDQTTAPAPPPTIAWEQGAKLLPC